MVSAVFPEKQWFLVFFGKTVGQAKGVRPGDTCPVSPGMSANARNTADTRFPEHPVGVNLSKTDILARAVVSLGVVSAVYSEHRGTGPVGGVPGVWGYTGTVRTLVVARGMGPGACPGRCFACFWLYSGCFGCIRAVF